jgi:hypothetical protein
MSEKKKDDIEVLVTFLKETRKGKYAPIERSSLPYARIKYHRMDIENRDTYYYGIS